MKMRATFLTAAILAWIRASHSLALPDTALESLEWSQFFLSSEQQQIQQAFQRLTAVSLCNSPENGEPSTGHSQPSGGPEDPESLSQKVDRLLEELIKKEKALGLKDGVNIEKSEPWNVIRDGGRHAYDTMKNNLRLGLNPDTAAEAEESIALVKEFYRPGSKSEGEGDDLLVEDVENFKLKVIAPPRLGEQARTAYFSLKSPLKEKIQLDGLQRFGGPRIGDAKSESPSYNILYDPKTLVQNNVNSGTGYWRASTVKYPSYRDFFFAIHILKFGGKELEWIAAKTVANAETRRILTATPGMPHKAGQRATFRPLDDGFYALLNTPNLRFLTSMLYKYSGRIGPKDIEYIKVGAEQAGIYIVYDIVAHLRPYNPEAGLPPRLPPLLGPPSSSGSESIPMRPLPVTPSGPRSGPGGAGGAGGAGGSSRGRPSRGDDLESEPCVCGDVCKLGCAIL